LRDRGGGRIARHKGNRPKSQRVWDKYERAADLGRAAYRQRTRVVKAMQTGMRVLELTEGRECQEKRNKGSTLRRALTWFDKLCKGGNGEPSLPYEGRGRGQKKEKWTLKRRPKWGRAGKML